MTDVPPTEAPPPHPRRHAPSVVLLHTGDGKGKTTAAMGILMRSVRHAFDAGIAARRGIDF